MKRLTLIVSGNVQKGGYRDIIIRLGTAFGLRGYAENLPDGRVKVVAEGEENKIELLKVSADIKNTLIHVDEIESSFSNATGEFSGFYKLVREGETDERLDRAAELLKEVIVAMNKGFNRLGDGQDKMLEKQDKMLERQDKMLERQDKMLEKQDMQIEITRTGFSEMKEEFREVKEEMKKGFAD